MAPENVLSAALTAWRRVALGIGCSLWIACLSSCVPEPQPYAGPPSGADRFNIEGRGSAQRALAWPSGTYACAYSIQNNRSDTDSNAWTDAGDFSLVVAGRTRGFEAVVAARAYNLAGEADKQLRVGEGERFDAPLNLEVIAQSGGQWWVSCVREAA